MRVNKEVEVKDILSFSGLEEDVRSVNVPAGRYDFVKVFIDYTVTDADISAGENFQGVLNYMQLGEGDNTVFDIHTDELEAFIAGQEEDHEARYYDPTPTTATQQHAFAMIEGPFNLSGMAVPQLTLALQAPTAEFGAASAFTAKVRIVLVQSEEDDASGVVYTRVKRGSDALHQLSLGPGTVTEILLLTSNVSELSMGSSDGLGGQHASDMDINTKYPVQYEDNYNVFKDTASRVTGRFLIQDLFTEYYAGRKLVVELSAAAAATVFAKNLVVYA